ncbi:MAG: hypothetical protein GX417_00340 [Clostridiales bacterium]|nr:hypothetical protein [Clostridiales bacterium]
MQNTGAYGSGSSRGNDPLSYGAFSGNAPYSSSGAYSYGKNNTSASCYKSEPYAGGYASAQSGATPYTSSGESNRAQGASAANQNGAPRARTSYTDYSAYANGVAPRRDTPQNGANKSNAGGNGYSSGKVATKVYGAGGSGSSSGNGSMPRGGSSYGGGNGGSGGKPPKKPKSFNVWFKSAKKKTLNWIKRALRSIYLLGKPMRIFITSAFGFVLVSVVLIFAVSGSKHKKAEAMAEELALATTPVPTIAATATLEPTPSPTPEIRIEKGAEGEDVMTLQKRLMELGYLAIDEPTSYYGNATKYAVKLFQRQHELQEDGICGNDTIAQLYSEEAKPYVMFEGAEGDDITAFQEQLEELGYLDSTQITGYYGTDTVSAVTKFQHRNYLTEDGKAGEKTLEAINSPDARVSYTKEQEIIAEKKKQAELARASSAEGRIDKLISIAKKQLGDPYVLGKSGPDSFDCSGLVYYCLRQVNVYTRRLNAAGLSKTTSWTKVSSLSSVKKGDLLFFKSDDSSTIGHVGIYIGGGEMIDASSANGKVVRRSAKSSYWRRNFVVARRPIE